jgi:hypothetical protein
VVRTTVLAAPWLVAVLAVVVGVGLGCAGCRGRGNDGPPCSAAAAKFLDIARYDLAGAKVGDATKHAVTDQLPAMRDALAQACTEGRWSAAVRNCLVLANDRIAFEACEQQLTDEQRRDLDRGTRGLPGSP